MMTDDTRRPRREFPIDRARAPEGVVERTCIGCGKRAPDEDVLRLALMEAPDGTTHVVPDTKGSASGRGAHVHPSPACIVLACKKGLPRAFKRELHVDPVALSASISAAFGRRMEGLLAGGVRSKLVVFGSDAVADTIRSGSARLIVLAADSASAAMRTGVQRATAEGKTLVFGDKLRLARAIGRKAGEEREGVAVLSVTNVALATAIRRAWLCAVGLSSEGSRRGVEAVEDSPENGESEAR